MATLVCFFQGEHTRVKLLCLVVLQHFICQPWALWRLVTSLSNRGEGSHLVFITPQSDFNKAIGWWLETGIYAKMEDDVGRNKNWTTAWTKPTNRKREPLEMSHVQPLFIIFGAGIMASVIAFGFEFQSRPRMKEILRPHYESSKYTGNHLWSIHLSGGGDISLISRFTL